MSSPLISIIIPTFNREHLIGDTIESIINQTYSNWECIIIDDGSIDNTEILIEQYSKKNPNIKYYKRPNKLKKGPSSCRNLGFEKSNGDWIKWLDSDDLLFENALETTLPFLNSQNDLIVSKLVFVDENKLILNRKHSIFSKNIVEDYLVGAISFYTITPTWKRSFLETQKELFDVNIGNLDDWDFNLRMIYQKPKIIYIDKPLIKYRVHDNSLSNELGKLNIKEIKSEFLAREKHIEILKKDANPAKKTLQDYIKKRYKYFFRVAVLNGDKSKFYLYKKLLQYQIKSFDFMGIFKTVFGVLVFKVFNKGYKLLK